MKYIIHITLVASLLSSCGGGATSKVDSPTPEDEVITSLYSFSGKVIDGYIKNASLCIDLDMNQRCDSHEPTTQSLNDGSFNFSKIQITGNFTTLISTGGIDTVTNQTYQGTLKYITSTPSYPSITLSQIYITPLHNLVTSLFLAENPDLQNTTSTQLDNANTAIFNFFSVPRHQSPMDNKDYFLANQNIEIIKNILLRSAKNDLEIADDSQAYIPLQNNISYAIAKQLSESTSRVLNIEQILVNFESLQAATLHPDLRAFIVEQVTSNQAFFESARNIDININHLEDIQRSITSDMEPVYDLLTTPSDQTAYSVLNMDDFEALINNILLTNLYVPSNKGFNTPPQMPF